ncbi:MAG: hypothetical protein GY940_18935 [bacterium]|nr:hypothetical protein [bacterium]
MTDFFIKHCPVESVVNVVFEFNGELKPYRKILTYAAAKNALVLMTQSFEHYYPDTRFSMVTVPTLEGAAVPSKANRPVPPEEVAKDIYSVIKE